MIYFVFFTFVRNEQTLQQGAQIYCSIFFINSQLQNFLQKIERQNPKLYKLLQEEQQKQNSKQNTRVLEEKDKKKEVVDEQIDAEKQKKDRLVNISNGTLAQGIVQNRSDDYSVIDKDSGQLYKKQEESNALKDLSEQKIKLQKLVQDNTSGDLEILKNKQIDDKENQKILQERKNINQARDYTIEIECKTIGEFYEQQTMMRINCKKTDVFTIYYPDKDRQIFKIMDYLEGGAYKSRMIQINYESGGAKDTLAINQNRDFCNLYISSSLVFKMFITLLFTLLI